MKDDLYKVARFMGSVQAAGVQLNHHGLKNATLFHEKSKICLHFTVAQFRIKTVATEAAESFVCMSERQAGI